MLIREISQINGRGEVRRMTVEEIKQTMQLINGMIHDRCKRLGDSAKEVYLLSLALKELNQLEPKDVK